MISSRTPIAAVIDTNAPHAMDTSYSWRVAAVTLVMASLGFGAITAVPVLLKPIAAEWGRSVAEIATVHSATLLGAGVSSLWIGRLHDPFGFFPLAVTASVANGLGLKLASTASDLVHFALAFGVLVGACGQGVLFSPLTAAVSQWSLAVGIGQND